MAINELHKSQSHRHWIIIFGRSTEDSKDVQMNGKAQKSAKNCSKIIAKPIVEAID